MKTTVHAGFEDLPSEITHDIVRQTDTKTALALAATCRKLRAMTYVPFTFRKLIAAYQRLYLQSLSNKNETEEELQIPDEQCLDTKSWARYSIAMETLYSLLVHLVKTDLNNLANAFNTAAVADAELKATFTKFAACQWTLITICDSFFDQHRLLKLVLDAIKVITEPNICKDLLPFLIATVLQGNLEIPHDHLWSTLIKNVKHWSLRNWHAKLGTEELDIYAAIVLRMASLCQTLPIDQLSLAARKRIRALDFPHLSTIQFPKQFKDVLPSGPSTYGMKKDDDDARLWHRNFAVQKNLDFLTSGKWYGCYTYTAQSGQCDVIMRNVQFQRVREVARQRALKTVDNAVVLEAQNCSDQWGTFAIYLSVSERTGRFRGKKVYDRGASWAWSGAVTAFGLVGSWGEEVWGGATWCWSTKEALTH